MKEHPILFSGPMVQAILSGQKTVTRREVKKRNALDCLAAGFEPSFLTAPGNADMCPYGQVGDRLWVREAWAVGKPHDSTRPADILPSVVSTGQGVTVLYPAGGWKSFGPAGRKEPDYPDNQPMPDWAGKGRPSIHLPRALSRILLEVTAVRVERLQDITPEQALAEGVMSAERDIDPDGNDYSPCELFGGLWSMVNGMDSWQANPWVWVVDFKRVQPCQ